MPTLGPFISPHTTQIPFGGATRHTLHPFKAEIVSRGEPGMIYSTDLTVIDFSKVLHPPMSLVQRNLALNRSSQCLCSSTQSTSYLERAGLALESLKEPSLKSRVGAGSPPPLLVLDVALSRGVA